MTVIDQLGSARVGRLAVNRPKNENKFLTPLVCETVPKNFLKSTNGLIPVLEPQSSHPQASTPTKVGWGVAAHTHVAQFTTRSYTIERYAERRGYEDALSGEELASQVRDSFMPGIEDQLKLDVDQKTFIIMDGTGISGNSRDVTVVKPDSTAGYGGAVWSTTAAIMDDLEVAVDATGGDLMYISTDLARIFARNSQFHSILAANSDGIIMMADLIAKLTDHLGLSTVVVGRRIYHDGVETASLDLKYTLADACFVTRKSNMAFCNWTGGEGVKFKEYQEDAESMTYIQGDHESDVVVVDPALAIAFDDPQDSTI